MHARLLAPPPVQLGARGQLRDDPPRNTIALWQALYEAGADLVLSGHAHPTSAMRRRTRPRSANAFGLREFVVGTGGASLGTFGATQPNIETRDNTQVRRDQARPEGERLRLELRERRGYDRDSGSGELPRRAAGHDAAGDLAQLRARGADSEPRRRASRSRRPSSGRASGAGWTARALRSGPTLRAPRRGRTRVWPTASTPSPSTRATRPATSTRRPRRARSPSMQRPPDTSITDGPSGTISATSASFLFAASEAGATFECRLDGGAWAGCGSPASLRRPGRGPAHVRDARDGRGGQHRRDAGRPDVHGRLAGPREPAPARRRRNEPPRHTPSPTPLTATPAEALPPGGDRDQLRPGVPRARRQAAALRGRRRPARDRGGEEALRHVPLRVHSVHPDRQRTRDSLRKPDGQLQRRHERAQRHR